MLLMYKFCNLAVFTAGIGFAAVMVAAFICFYYNVIIAWCLYYFFASMTDVLPWTECGSWSTEYCFAGSESSYHGYSHGYALCFNIICRELAFVVVLLTVSCINF